jgi:AcrR family transcriptional regulator
MSRSEALNRQIRDTQRQRILQAALELFARKGLAASGSAEIAAAAGVSSGLIYHYFPSKEAIYVALVRRAMEAATELTQSVLEAPGTPWQRLRSLCVQMFAGVTSVPEYTIILLQTAVGGFAPEEVRPIVHQHAGLALANITRLIREGQAAGEVADGDPEEMAQILYSIVLGGLAGMRLTGIGSDAYPMADTVMRVLKPCS